jgi:hypothetical protein
MKKIHSWIECCYWTGMNIAYMHLSLQARTTTHVYRGLCVMEKKHLFEEFTMVGREE